MKVIKINKSIRRGDIIHYLVVYDAATVEEINYLVSDWCESDLNGSSYGYTYSWSVVEDESMISKVLLNEVEKKNKAIVCLNYHKAMIEDYLNKQNS